MSALDIAMEPDLIDLGIALGVLTPASTPTSPVFNQAWFADPLGHLGGVLRNEDQREAAVRLAARVLGTLRDGLDLPLMPPGETWLPLVRSDGDAEAGLYAVIEAVGGGVRVSLAGRIAAEAPGLEAGCTVRVPLVFVDASSGQVAAFLPSTPQGDVEVAVSVALAGGIGGGPVELDGAAVSLVIPTDGREPGLALTLRGLRLGDDAPPRDVVLSGPDDLDDAVVEVLVALLDLEAGAETPLAHLLGVLGLAGRPGIPALGLAEVLADGVPALRRWFVDLLGDPVGRTAWLQEVGDLLAAPVSGTGAMADPYELALLDSGGARVALTLRFQTDPASGALEARPGVRATARTSGAAVPARADVWVEPCAVVLGHVLAVTPLSLAEAVVTLGPRPSQPLVDASMAGPPPIAVSVGSVRLGLGLDPVLRPVPILEARDITVGGAAYAAVDLTNADAVAALAAGAADAVLDAVLDPLRQALEASPPARALAALAGLRRPTGVGSGAAWPDLVDPVAMLSDPLGAVGAYHARVLAVPGAWGHLAAEIAGLLNGVAVPAAAGDGTPERPWSADVVADLQVLAWTTVEPRPRLHLGVRLAPAQVAVGSKTVRLHADVEVVAADLPMPGLAPPAAAWAGAHTVWLAVGGGLELELGSLGAQIQEVALGVRWSEASGLQTAFDIVDPRVRTRGQEVFLPPFGAEFGGPVTGLEGDMLPWRQIEEFAGACLARTGAGARLATLLGWLPAAELDLPGLVEGPPIIVADEWPALELDVLLADPAHAVQRWLGAVLGEADSLGLAFAARLGSLLGDGDVADGVLRSPITGSGRYDDPWAIGVDSGAPSAEIVAWLDPDGPSTAGLDDVAACLLPSDLVEATRGGGAVEPHRIAEVLGRAAALLDELAGDLVHEEDVGGRLAALLDRLGDGDGLVSAASQAPATWPTVAATATAHLRQPAAFDPAVHLPGGPAASHRVFVAAALPGVAPWPGQTPERTIDLRARGLVPEAFDLSHVTGGGPWFVLLPTRADAVVEGDPRTGLAQQVARLRRAVAAVRAQLPGDASVALVAHSVAGHAARLLAAEPGISDLVTLGTPFDGAAIDLLDDVDTGPAVRLLQRLATDLPADTAAQPLVDVIESAATVLDGYAPDDTGAPVHRPLSSADFTAPAFPPLHPATSARAVVAVVAAADLARAAAGLAEAVIDARMAPGEPATTFGAGVRIGARTEAPVGAVNARADIRLDLWQRAILEGEHRPVPRASLRVELYRTDGWLVGGPTGSVSPSTAKDPRVRWAEVEFTLDAGGATAAVTLHDTAVFGFVSPRIRLDGAGLPPEVRVLLGEVAKALGPLPEAGPVRAAADLLAAVGVVEMVDGVMALRAEGLELLLDDPDGELAERLAAPAARTAALAAFAALLGPAATVEEDTLAVAVASGLELVVTLSPKPMATLRADGLELGGVAVDGAVDMPLDAPPAANVRLRPLDADAPMLVVDLDPQRADMVVVHAEFADAVLPLHPAPDVAALSDLLLLAPGEMMRLVLEWLTAQGPPGTVDFVEALGLRTDSGGIRNPAGLLRDPAGWIAQAPAAAVGGSRARALVDGVRGLLALPAGSSGVLALPWDAELVVTGDADVTLITLRRALPLSTGPVAAHGSVTVRVDTAGDVTAAVAAGVSIPGLAGALDTVALDFSFDGHAGASATLEPAGGGAPLVVRLLPDVQGLAALAALAPGQAVAALLPMALDALTHIGADDPGGPAAALGNAVATLGDGLGVRIAERFDADALVALAGDPAGVLAARLEAAPGDLLAAFGALAGAVLGDGAVTSPDGRTLRLSPVAGMAVELTAPSSAVARLCLEATGVLLRPGVEVDASLCVDTDGRAEFAAALDVVDPGLLAAGGIALLPLVRLEAVAAPSGVTGQIDAGLFIEPPGPSRTAVVALVPIGGGAPSVVCRSVAGTVVSDSSDLADCAVAIVRAWLAPLLLDLLTGLPEVHERLDAAIAGTATSLGALLEDAGLLERQPTTASQPERFRPIPGILDDMGLLGRRVLALAAHAVEALGALASPAGLPLKLGLASGAVAGRTVYGLHLELTQPLALPAAGGLRVQVENDADWLDDPQAQPGVDLLLISLPTGTLDAADVRLSPWIRAYGLGLRVSDTAGGKLVDSVVGLDAVALHSVYERNAAVAANNGITRAGARVEVRNLTIPLGAGAGGDNPVASALLAPAPGSATGDDEPLAPAFSPQLVLLRGPSGAVDISLRAGPGEGPWWLAIQRSFGPLYVEQVGLGVEEADSGGIEALRFLMDGGVSLAGLAVGVEALSLRVPWDDPAAVDQWQLDLAGLAVGYSGGAVAIAGGLRKSTATPADYTGMVVIKAGQFGITAVGGYGVFPVPGSSGDTYTSLFLFGALAAPLGGPPAFFVTGIGAGVGVNRRLVLPSDIGKMNSYPLVAALDGGGELARDPMAALVTLGETFPPERGVMWFAAGVRFTSFTLVEAVAVLSVEVGGGELEVSLLGLARAALPSAALPIAMVELGLRASFSTREGTLRVQAQLTDNSWLINESCRLTGGFAFVIWFKTGNFVLTLGGYHPSFNKPADFPDVPRVGFNWSVSDAISVKGEAYFALTATCVMAGGRLEASADFGAVWGSFEAGMNALVRWDPLYYDVWIGVTISGGARIRGCVWTPFGKVCAEVSVTVSKGAQLHLWGPKLRGRVTVDFGVASISIPFGPSSATDDRVQISWTAFHDRYLVAGDPSGETMDAAVTRGLAAVERQPEAGSSDDAAATGKADSPWLVLPEFALVTSTRSASTVVHGTVLSDITSQHLDLGPAGVADISSEHRVQVFRQRPDGGEVDVTGSLTIRAEVGPVPEGVWRTYSGHSAPAEAKVRPALVGATIEALATVAGDDVGGRLDQVERSEEPHPLPFAGEIAEREAFRGDVRAADRYAAAQPKVAEDILAAAEQKTGAGRGGRSGIQAYRSDVVAPPRLVSLAEGMVDTVAQPVEVRVAERAQPQKPAAASILPPRLVAVLGGFPTMSSPVATSATRAGRGLARVPAPTLSGTVEGDDSARLGARLQLVDPPPLASEDRLAPRLAAARAGKAGAGVEYRAGLGGSAAGSDVLRRVQDGDGFRVAGGDIAVWELPAAEHDQRGKRPSVRIEGDQPTRLVAVDRAGDVLVDAKAGGSVAVPRGASRFALVGLGADTAENPVAGWHSGSRLALIAPGVYLSAGAVVRASGPQTLRRGRSVDAAVVRGASVCAGAGMVETRLAAPVNTVLVALEALEEGAGLDGLVMGLEGAVRTARRDGTPLPPQIVVSGQRVHGVFSVTPNADAVTVRIAADERWRLVGVAGAEHDAAWLAERVEAVGLEEVVGSVAPGAAGSSRLRWVDTDEQRRG